MKPINLLPRVCIEAAQRRRRTRNWTVLCGVAAMGIAGASAMVRMLPMRLEHDREAVRKIDEECTELQRRVVAATKTRDELLMRVATLRSIRQPSFVPAQLQSISDGVPEEVKLTRLSIRRGETVVAGAQATSKPATPKSPTAARDTPAAPITELTGFAVDHVALNLLVRTLERAGQWSDVNLRRASSEKFGSGNAIAFQIECRGRREQP